MTKTILITGASSEIGRATAKLFSDKSWNVAATMRSPEEETELRERSNLKLYRLVPANGRLKVSPKPFNTNFVNLILKLNLLNPLP